VDRLISPEKPDLTLDSLERASAALDFGLVVRLVPKATAAASARHTKARIAARKATPPAKRSVARKIAK
jgi:hypothetical protein